MSDFLFSLPMWVVVVLAAWPFIAVALGLLIGAMFHDRGRRERRIERIERRMVALNRQDVAERARDCEARIHFDGGWSR